METKQKSTQYKGKEVSDSKSRMKRGFMAVSMDYLNPQQTLCAKTWVICGFYGVGKTTVCSNKEYDAIEIETFEDEKTFIRKVEEQIGAHMFILTSAHPNVLKALENAEINHIVVFPDKSRKEEFLSNYEAQNACPHLYSALDDQWERMFDKMCKVGPVYKPASETKSGNPFMTIHLVLTKDDVADDLYPNDDHNEGYLIDVIRDITDVYDRDVELDEIIELFTEFSKKSLIAY